MGKGFYKSFEDKYRGTRDLIKSRLQVYLPLIETLKALDPQPKVLDLGCGRGEWLEILNAAEFNAHGVDHDEEMVAFCHNHGFSTTNQDIIECLKAIPDKSYLIVSGFHVVEHIPFEQLQLLVYEALRILKPCGLLILETPNPENLVVGTNSFYLDPTHIRPLPPDLLAYLPEYYGYNRTRILRLQESPELAVSKELQLMDVISGVSPDYAVIAQKNGPREQLDKMNSEFNKEYGLDLQTLANRYEQKIIGIASITHETKTKTIALEIELQKQNLHTVHESTVIATELQKQNIRMEGFEIALTNELKIKTINAERAEARTALLKEQYNQLKIEKLNEKISNLQTLLDKTEKEVILWKQYVNDGKARASILDSERITLNNTMNAINNLHDYWRSRAEIFQLQLAAIHSSNSWRITLPLRLIAKGCYCFFNLFLFFLKNENFIKNKPSSSVKASNTEVTATEAMLQKQ